MITLNFIICLNLKNRWAMSPSIETIRANKLGRLIKWQLSLTLKSLKSTNICEDHRKKNQDCGDSSLICDSMSWENHSLTCADSRVLLPFGWIKDSLSKTTQKSKTTLENKINRNFRDSWKCISLSGKCSPKIVFVTPGLATPLRLSKLAMITCSLTLFSPNVAHFRSF